MAEIESDTNNHSAKEDEETEFFIMRKNNDHLKLNKNVASIDDDIKGEPASVNDKIILKENDSPTASTKPSPANNNTPVFDTGATIAAAIQALKASASNLNSENTKAAAQNFPFGTTFFPMPAFTLSLPNNSEAMNVGNSDMKFLILPVHQCWGCRKEFTDMELFTEHVTKSLCLTSVDTRSSSNETPQLPSDTTTSLSDQAVDSSFDGPSESQEKLSTEISAGRQVSTRGMSTIESVIDSVLENIRNEIANESVTDNQEEGIAVEVEPMELGELKIDEGEVGDVSDTNNNKNSTLETLLPEVKKEEMEDAQDNDEIIDEISDRLEIDSQHPARLKKAVYTCFECNQEFHTNIGLLRHQSNVHGAKQFPCGIVGCSKVFKNESALSDHKKRVHGPRSFACVHCNAYFTTETYLKAHVKIHLEKKHVCKECKHSFVNKTDLNNHMRVHTGVKPYSCKVCGKAFRHVSGYYTHVRIHTGETPYQCEFCDKKFTNASNFQTHRKIHTQDKKFKCEECGKEFIQQSNFTRHKRTHTKERPYKCSTCGEQFSYSTCLKKHLKKDHGVEPLECDLCKRTFLNHSSFVRHRTGCQFKDIVKKEAEADSAQFL